MNAAGELLAGFTALARHLVRGGAHGTSPRFVPECQAGGLGQIDLGIWVSPTRHDSGPSAEYHTRL